LFFIILINLKKNKTLINYFSAYFPWHNQTLKNIFQFIFHYTTKHQKIIHFPEIYFFKIQFLKKKKFPANKPTLITSNYSSWPRVFLCQLNLKKKKKFLVQKLPHCIGQLQLTVTLYERFLIGESLCMVSI
jgi:hypothetical protein